MNSSTDSAVGSEVDEHNSVLEIPVEEPVQNIVQIPSPESYKPNVEDISDDDW